MCAHVGLCRFGALSNSGRQEDRDGYGLPAEIVSTSDGPRTPIETARVHLGSR